MPRYIMLINFTEQGVKTIGDWDNRLVNGRKMIEEAGGKLVEAYLTLGPYDAVLITEAKDDDAALSRALHYNLFGNGRTLTMRAFTETESVRVTKSLA